MRQITKSLNKGGGLMEEKVVLSANNPITYERLKWEKSQKKHNYYRTLTLFSPIFLLLLWEILSRTALIDPRFFPPPSEIIVEFAHLVATGQLFGHVAVSLYRIFGGFLLGVIPGIIIGLLIGMYTPVRYKKQKVPSELWHILWEMSISLWICG